MEKYYPEGDANSNFNSYGHMTAQALVELLKRCGDNLTRENIMKQASNLKDVELDLLLPGIKINTSPTDFYPIQSVQMARVKGNSFELFGSVLSNESTS